MSKQPERRTRTRLSQREGLCTEGFALPAAPRGGLASLNTTLGEHTDTILAASVTSETGCTHVSKALP